MVTQCGAPCLMKNITRTENVQTYYWHEQPVVLTKTNGTKITKLEIQKSKR